MRTLLTHVYNEEFLLPKWLEHHSKIFDRIIVIDYDSTDDTSWIVQKFGDKNPNYNLRLRDSRNEDFGAMNVDLEIEDTESSIEGWKMCLNVTEFLHGDFSKCTETPSQHVIPSFMVVDPIYRNVASFDDLDFDQVDTGIPHWVWNERAGRSFHNFNINYPKPGRHFFDQSSYSKDFMIFHYGWYPMCEQTLSRKLQIQTRIPETDRQNRLGWHHLTNREALIEKWKTQYFPKIENYSDYLNKWRKLTEDTKGI